VDVVVEPGVSGSRAVTGDLSFDAWASARVAGLLRFAYLVTGSQHAAEDAVQDALTSACATWSRVSRTRDPDAYVRRMIANAHVSPWRRHGRRVVPVADLAEPPGRHAADPADGVSTNDAVWRVCSTLPRQQRAAVVLRFYEDLDYAEIAALTGVREGSVRSRVSRGIAAMRHELGEDDMGDGHE